MDCFLRCKTEYLTKKGGIRLNKKELSIEELQAISGGFTENVNSTTLLAPIIAYGIFIPIMPIIKKILGL